MIKKFISNVMLSIFMDKQAKEKFHALKKGHKKDKQGLATSVQTENAINQENLSDSKSMSRQELIKRAMEIHKEKSKILDKLTLSERRKLKFIAMQVMKGKVGGGGAN